MIFLFFLFFFRMSHLFFFSITVWCLFSGFAGVLTPSLVSAWRPGWTSNPWKKPPPEKEDFLLSFLIKSPWPTMCTQPAFECALIVSTKWAVKWDPCDFLSRFLRGHHANCCGTERRCVQTLDPGGWIVWVTTSSSSYNTEQQLDSFDPVFSLASSLRDQTSDLRVRRFFLMNWTLKFINL